MQVFTGIINIVLSVIWGMLWGVFGIFAATVVARLCTHLWHAPYVVYKHGFAKPVYHYWKTYFQYLLVLIIAAVGCKLSFTFISGSLLMQALLKILFCSVITNTVFAVAFCKTKEFAKLKEYIRAILNKRK